MTTPDKRLVLPNTNRRDMLIAVACGLAVLGLIVFAIVAMSRQQGAPSSNHLSGTITAKHYSGEREHEVSFGTKGLKSQEVDSGYSFDIHVPAENRNYEVPVGKTLYDSRKVGDTQDFIRPPSEQK